MAFLFSSNKTPAETAGPAAEPEMACRYPKLNAAAAQKKEFQHSLIMTPLTSPEVEIPYCIRQSGGLFGQRHHYLVTFNTHTANFTVHEFKDKAAAKEAYTDALAALQDDVPAFKQLGETKVSFFRGEQGAFRRKLGLTAVQRLTINLNPRVAPRRAQVKDRFLNFEGAMLSTTRSGAIRQWATPYTAQSLKGLTGSWDRMLEYGRIVHDAGSQQASIGASVADFIGLWSSVTGNVASLGLANGGYIDSSAEFQSMWKQFTAAALKSRGNPHNSTKIVFSYDTASAWV